MKTVLTAAVLMLGLFALWSTGWLAAWLPAGLQRTDDRVAAPAAVYVWTDARGQKHYGDAPPPSGQAVQAELPQLTVVTLPKAVPKKPEAAVQAPVSSDDETPAPATPSRQMRNPVLERMGLSD